MAKQQNVSLIDIVGMSDVMGRPRYRSNIGRFLLRWILDMSTDTYMYIYREWREKPGDDDQLDTLFEQTNQSIYSIN
jgi:hypothetical protein